MIFGFPLNEVFMVFVWFIRLTLIAVFIGLLCMIVSLYWELRKLKKGQ